MKLKMETTAQGKCLEQFLSYCLLELQLILIKKRKEKNIYIYACNFKNNNTFMFYIRESPNNLAFGAL